MTLTQLKYFLALCEAGTFASAAEQCFVSQPTLSLQLKKLETFVGASLIDRSQNPVKPTPFGIIFAEQTKAVFGEVSKLEALFEAESPNLDGHLVMGCIPTVAYYLLLPLVQAFKAQYPELTVSIYELPTHEVLDRLESGFLDAAIVAGPIQSRHLYEQPLYYEPFVALLNQSSAVNLSKAKGSSVKSTTVKSTTVKPMILAQESLAKLSLLMLSEEHCLRGQTLSLCQANERSPRKATIECSNVAMMKSLVQADVAAAVLPRLCVSEEENFSELTKPQTARVISMVYRKNYHKTRTLDALKATVLEQVPKAYTLKGDYKIVGIDHD